jgi:hypothetical protein
LISFSKYSQNFARRRGVFQCAMLGIVDKDSVVTQSNTVHEPPIIDDNYSEHPRTQDSLQEVLRLRSAQKRAFFALFEISIHACHYDRLFGEPLIRVAIPDMLLARSSASRVCCPVPDSLCRSERRL